MSVLYNTIQRVEPGVEGGGTRKYYASSVIRDTIGIKELTHEIARLSTVNGADVSAVLHGIEEVVPELLAKGFSVQLGDFGFFRISLSSNGSETEDEVSAANIRGKKVVYRPGENVVGMLNNLKFEKA